MSKIGVTIGGKTFEIEIEQSIEDQTRFAVRVEGMGDDAFQAYLSEPDPATPVEWVVIDQRPYELIFDRDLRWVQSSGKQYMLELRDLEATVSRPTSGDGRLKSPIPGLVTQVMVEAGETVEAGQPLLILEAMKMENEIRAPRAGVIEQLNVQPGQSVPLGTLLAEIV